MANGQDERIDMRPLIRLGAWGSCALIALAAAVFVGRTETGTSRASGMFAAITGARANQPAQIEPVAISAIEKEAQKLAETVQALTAERERLANRVATLERSVDDRTGSVAAGTPPDSAATSGSAAAEPSTPVASVAEASRPAGPAGIPIPRPAPLTVINSYVTATLDAPEGRGARAVAPPSVAPVATPAAVPAATPEPAQPRLATPTAAAPAAPAATPALPPRADFAVDLGQASSADPLRVLWNQLKTKQAAHLGNVHPYIVNRTGAQPGTTEMHLIAGPLDASAAAQLCTKLKAAGAACEPTVYGAQRQAVH